MDEIKSHFVFNRSQRNGILFLIFFISGFLVISYYIDFSEENTMDMNSEEVIAQTARSETGVDVSNT